MRKWILAAVVAVAAMAQPGYSQQTEPDQTVEVVTATNAEPIPVSEETNKVSPGSFAGMTAGIGIVVLGLVILSGLAFMPSS